MSTLLELLGASICIAPIIAVVIYLAWATRQPHCPACMQRLARDETTCPHCGATRED